MPRTATGTVYALVDPRDNTIRYIGKTEQPVHTRLGQHLAYPTNPAMRIWINVLGLQGMSPRSEVVATVPVHRLDIEEQRQIRRHAKAGHRILNSPYYHEHVDDLSNGPSVPEGPAPAEVQERPDQRVAWHLFGALARAQAEGRVSGWAVAFIVAASTPVYFALLLLRPLLASKTGVRALLACAFGWICWESGFDRAVKDLVLARLPIGEMSALWASYGSAPMDTLASGLTWPFVIASVWMTGIAYWEVAERLR